MKRELNKIKTILYKKKKKIFLIWGAISALPTVAQHAYTDALTST